MSATRRSAGLPCHGDMVAAILAVYDGARPDHRADGADWYPTAGRMVRTIADVHGADPHRVAHALAALSPRNPWRWNVADAYAYTAAARAVADGAPDAPPPATTFAVNRAAAWRALRDSGAPWKTAAPKVRAFVAAIMGDPSAVVVDVWAMRVATGGTADQVREREYEAIVAAYTAAAAMRGTDPRTMQAVTWRAAQDAGLGTGRRGRHDLAFKRGTAPAVRAMFGEA